MTRSAPARAGALTLALTLAGSAACSSHVDVGLSRDAGAPPKPDASEGGSRTDAGVSDSGVTRTEPWSDEATWAHVSRAAGRAESHDQKPRH
jgi:hypothetical protein